MKARKGFFSIDGGATFPGMTYGETWNGWARPMFESRIMDAIAASARECRARGDRWQRSPAPLKVTKNKNVMTFISKYPKVLVYAGLLLALGLAVLLDSCTVPPFELTVEPEMIEFFEPEIGSASDQEVYQYWYIVNKGHEPTREEIRVDWAETVNAWGLEEGPVNYSILNEYVSKNTIK